MTEPVWMGTARTLIGTKEGAGAADNPTILSWAKKLGGWEATYYNHDSIPWCSLFVTHVLEENSIHGPRGFLAAKSYLNWGEKTDPCPGAIMVFGRDGGGHVAFYVGEDKTNYHVLGGNQSDSVSVTMIDKDRLLDARWPSGVAKTNAAPNFIKTIVNTFKSVKED